MAFNVNGLVRFGVLLLCAGMLGVAYACNGGYKIRVTKIENCAGPDAIITVDENFTAVLTKNCVIKSRGCVRIKDFKTATARYTVTKDGMQLMQGSTNICEQGERPKGMEPVAEMLRTMGLPEQCPVDARQICTDPSQVLDINRYKSFLPLARGAIGVDVAVQHDTGNSCFKIRFDITK